MSERRRVPVVFTVLAVVLLVAPVGLVGWYLFTPRPDVKAVPPADELDIVCTGRVDTPLPVVSLDPSEAGRVVEVCPAKPGGPPLQEGDAVAKGQAILKMDDAAALNRVRQAAAAVKAATARWEQAKLDVDRFPEQLKAREAAVKASAERVLAARKTLEVRKAADPLTKLSQAELDGMTATVNEIELLRTAEELQLADLRKMKPQLLVDVAEAQLRAAEADQTLAQKSLDECVVKAPVPGRILRLQAGKGSVLAPGGYPPSVVFAPDGPLLVRAEIDQEFLGRVKPGMAAAVQDDNRVDATARTGRVKAVSRWVAQRRTLLLDPGELNDVRTVECVVELDPGGDELFIGQRMRVRIRTKP